MLRVGLFADWAYYLNTAGTELPLMTLDKLSRTLKGSIVESFPLPPGNQATDLIKK
jgi:hypothetical protein